MAGESTYVDRAPAPELTDFVSSVWIQRVGDRRVEQQHVPHGGAEVRCVLGEAPRLLGPLTTATYQEIPAAHREHREAFLVEPTHVPTFG